MSFPADVKTQALVACGRHCCLCHLYCGLKIELHHIVQESEGGTNGYDNCIPLCFNCHADMRSYDHEHPKGTKFTPVELREHRNRWYEKVRLTPAAASVVDDQNLDRQTMLRLVEILPWDGTIQFARHNNFAGFGFRREHLRDFADFCHECENPNFEFVDADLEGLRVALLASIKRFDAITAAETFPTGNSDVNSVPEEWEHEQPERFWRVVTEIHDSVVQICEAYDQLVKMGRRRLGVSQPVAD